MKKFLAFAALMAIFCHDGKSQVSAEYTPMPLSVLGPLGLKTVGPWSVRLCNDSNQTLNIPPERIYMAAPQIWWITPVLASNLITVKQSKTVPAKLAEYTEYAVDVAGMFGGTGTFFTLSTKGLAKLAAGSILAHYLQGKFQAAIPNVTPFTANLLTSNVVLQADQCGTFSLYAGKMKNPQPFSSKIVIPSAVPGQSSEIFPSYGIDPKIGVTLVQSSGSINPINWHTEVRTLTADQTSFTTAYVPQSDIIVTYNGLEMSRGVDYAVTSTPGKPAVVTFVSSQSPKIGDIVRLKYY